MRGTLWTPEQDEALRALFAKKLAYASIGERLGGDISDHSHRSAVALQRAVELKRARAEAQATSALFQSIIGGMRATDENFFSSQITEYERLVREISPVDRS